MSGRHEHGAGDPQATPLRQQTVLARFGELALRSEDLDAILHEACRLVGEALGTDLAKVIELQEDGRTLLVRAGVGWKPGVVGRMTLSAEENSSEGHALRTGEPVISPDVAAETRFHYPAFLTDNGVRALVNVPIIGAEGRRSFGILQVDSRQPRHFTENDVGFLRGYASLLAAAVERLRVIGDLRGSEARLRDSLDRQEAALGTGLIGFFEWDMQAGIVIADRRFAGFFGLDPATVAVGVPLAALFNVVHAEDRAEVEAKINSALGSLADCETEFRLVHSDGGVRWVRVRGHCHERDGKRPAHYTGTAVDVTASKRAEEALKRSNEALEARVADRTRELTAANARLRAEAAERERAQAALREANKMRALVEHLPIGAGLVAPSGQIMLANPEFHRLLRRPPASQDGGAEGEWLALHRDGRLVAPREHPAARALRGELVLNVDLLHRSSATDAGRWLRLGGIPVRGAAGVVAALVVVSDVHEERLAAERQDLLSREVDHRAKNMLAVVRAAIRLTRAEDVASFIRSVDGRVAALARSQTLLAAGGWSGADLHTLLEGELTAFLNAGGSGPRAELRGPRVALPARAAQPFSMAVHELATNATKHGALSVAAGRVSVEWSVAGPSGDRLRLRWAETDGPRPAGPPARWGFGSRVLNGTLRRQLGGSVAMMWEATGLVCDVELPLSR